MGLHLNVIIDDETFIDQLARAFGADPPPIPPSHAPSRRSCDINGRQVDPRAVVLAAIAGTVRRVVMGADSVVLDMGRKSRLFTGALRDAVMLGGFRCTHLGCHLKVEHCEADHLLPWAEHGETRADNGGPGCGHHNRWRNNGARSYRDAKGVWHTLRPDGTEIGWPRLHDNTNGTALDPDLLRGTVRRPTN